MPRKMPRQKPGQSEQSVETPADLLTAVKRFLGVTHFWIDLAADDQNRKARRYYSEKVDSLKQAWSWQEWSGGEGGRPWAWCNPPYTKIAPWVEKAFVEAMDKWADVAMLVPASVGSEWWARFVHEPGCTRVLLLRGRPTFVGHTSPYPKDLAVILYLGDVDSPFVKLPKYTMWDWRKQERRIVPL